jgi:hypothetical protein
MGDSRQEDKGAAMGDTRLTPTGVRLPAGLRDFYEDLARREHRSLSGQIIVALEEWRAQRERSEGAAITPH